MKPPNNEEIQVPTGHFLSPNEVSSARTGLHLIEFLARGASKESLNNPGYCRAIGCSPQNENQVPLLKTMPMQLLKMEMLSWCLQGASTFQRLWHS